tara:strand:+ start:312 stop:755 length:444 start_codon:yes stop_codon:yes gene_type:complete
MPIFKVRILHITAIASTCFCSCKKWDPDIQYTNDIISQQQELVLLEEQSRAAKQLELQSFIVNLSSQLGNNLEFLNWAKSRIIPFQTVSTVRMEEQMWENREYDFRDLINAKYGSGSEMSNFYSRVNNPKKLSLITNGKRIINPLIY